MKKGKYEYTKVLQGWFGAWEDLCFYEARSDGTSEHRKEIKDDLSSYRANDPRAYRVILRRERVS